MIGLLVFNVEILFGIGIVHLVLLLNQNIKYESKSKINRGFGGCNSQLNINSQHSRDYLYVCDNMVFKECELDFSAIDWEQRRYELAKAAMQGFCSNSHEQVMNASLNMTVEWSLGFADALIKKLKGE